MHGMNFKYKLFVMSLGLAHGLAFATQADVPLTKEDQNKQQIVNDEEEDEGEEAEEQAQPAVEKSAPSKTVVVPNPVEKITEQPKKSSDVFLEAIAKFDKFIVGQQSSEAEKKSSLEQLDADEKRREEKIVALKKQKETLLSENKTKTDAVCLQIAALDKMILDAEARKNNEAKTKEALNFSLEENLNKVNSLSELVNEESAKAKKAHAERVKEADSLTEKSLADSMLFVENAFDLCVREEGKTTTKCRASFCQLIMSIMPDDKTREELLKRLEDKADEQEKKASKHLAFTVSEGEKKKAADKITKEVSRALTLRDAEHKAASFPNQVKASAAGFVGGAVAVGGVVGGLIYKGILKK